MSNSLTQLTYIAEGLGLVGAFYGPIFYEGYKRRKQELLKTVRDEGRTYANRHVVQEIESYDGIYHNILTDSTISVGRKVRETAILALADFCLLGARLAERRFLAGKI